MRTQPFSFVLVLMAMATPARADFALVNADPPSIRKDAPNAV